MGATDIIIRGAGESMAKAFTALPEEAIYESGHDSYNGTISTISGWTDKTRDYQASGKSLDDYLDEQLEELDKREAAGICLQAPAAGKPGQYVFVGWAAD